MQQLLDEIRQTYPHLYDIQMELERIKAISGFGDLNMSLSMTKGVVERGELFSTTKRLYHRRMDGKMERILQ